MSATTQALKYSRYATVGILIMSAIALLLTALHYGVISMADTFSEAAWQTRWAVTWLVGLSALFVAIVFVVVQLRKARAGTFDASTGLIKGGMLLLLAPVVVVLLVPSGFVPAMASIYVREYAMIVSLYAFLYIFAAVCALFGMVYLLVAAIVRTDVESRVVLRNLLPWALLYVFAGCVCMGVSAFNFVQRVSLLQAALLGLGVFLMAKAICLLAVRFNRVKHK